MWLFDYFILGIAVIIWLFYTRYQVLPWLFDYLIILYQVLPWLFDYFVPGIAVDAVGRK